MASKARPRSRRALWKGAISFGLVHIPVSLHPAAGDSGIDFDWLDKRSMDPVGYKRINKRTGREIDKENIVRGVEHGDGRYVILSDQEIAAVYPRSTQMVEIERFVPAEDISFLYYERPYYLAPTGRGEKVYALLREALKKSGRAGLARVVIQTRQHLAALLPHGPALVLNLLRWDADLRSCEGLGMPAAGAKGAKVSPGEMQMAMQLIDSMSGGFEPEKFTDRFREQVMELVARRAKAGRTEEVMEPEEELPKGADIIDLTELLKRSLGERRPARAVGSGSSSSKASKSSAAAKTSADSKGKRTRGKAAAKRGKTSRAKNGPRSRRAAA
jgi:DNA end-binding protein Ku